MAMASLKESWKDRTEPAGVDTDEYYPTLYLSEPQLDAMGLKNDRVGTEMVMIATVRVASVSDNKNGVRSMTFELLEGEMKPKEEKPDPASILFPNEK